METSRDSSVWRTLALAFGDGLAFGVGVTLTRTAARLGAAKPSLHDDRTNGWAREVERRGNGQRVVEARAVSGDSAAAISEAPVEQRTETRSESPRGGNPLPAPGAPLKPQSADAVLALIDGRFHEMGGRMDRRLAELELKVKAELDNLDVQDHALAEGVESRVAALRAEIAEAVAAQRQSIDADMRGLRAQMTAVHKEFAETLARLMDEQIAKTIGARMQAVEAGLRETIREEVREEVREEMRQKGPDPRVFELETRVAAQEQNVLNLVMALGQSCLRAVERLAAPEPPEPPVGGAPAQPSEPAQTEASAAAADPDVPGFARARPRKPLWRVPIVPSFLAATGGLLLLHYL